MSLTAEDKLWIEGKLTDQNKDIAAMLSDLGSQLVDSLPKGWKYNVLVAALGFATASVVMDVKNKDIRHVSYPLAEIERLIIEGAGYFAVLTGGFLADYNRMYPSQSTTQLIIGLSNTQAQSLMKALRLRESSNNYKKIHEFGYLGGYGMGAGALADIGYLHMDNYQRAPAAVKSGSNKKIHLGFLQDERNWKKYSYQEFMDNPAVQDLAFIAYANKNIQRGFKAGALKRGDHKRLGGYAAAAHLVGPGNAFLYYGSNMNSDDRYGTTASEYASIGEKAIKGAAPKDFGVIPHGLPMSKQHFTRISSGFGARYINGHRSNHKGIDFAVPTGTPVKATADGKIVFAGNYSGACGYGVKIQHSKHYATVFCHLSRWDVRVSQWVRKGVKIGLSGGAKGSKGAGSSTGPHIHYSVKLKGKAIDPLLFIPELTGKKAFTIRPQQLPIIQGGQ